MDHVELLARAKVDDPRSESGVVLEGQYREAYDAMLDAHNAGLFVGLIGPVGAGKTALCRKFAEDLGRPFEWVTFSDLVRPANLVGSFDPTLVFKYGYAPEAFVPGPFTLAALKGGVFLANELNRGDEYVLNTMLDALEERRLYIPALRAWYRVHDDFYLIAAMNPAENRGTRRLPSAIRDRIKVWIRLAYPKRATELKIVAQHCREYELAPGQIELVLEMVEQTREDPAIESPASIRSSIGIARFAAERARRLGQPVDHKLLAQAARLVLSEAIRVKPGRNLEHYLDSLLTKTLGTTG
ncbi:AAA family ATPase [Sandaracinus amylolyticus]|uniref:MoxR-like ATPase n=1 Tax=Sandaracinus amylolyticus TaxID=927083 RepID=A0A0F6W2M4_9BACT|nr:MoxR family ATPase [Sandaracinus amylolyticus]AKF05861.1 MoxR-like ATPase [Sandaracinus amylolyticus]